MTSSRFVETLQIAAGAGATIELRAANDVRPTVVMSGAFQITGDQGARVFLNGFVITGGGVEIGGNLERCTLTHMTLVPGLSLNRDGTPAQPDEPSLVVQAQHAEVTILRSIVGGIRTSDDTVVAIHDSLVDATAPVGLAIGGLSDGEGDDSRAGGLVTITNSTVIGRVHAEVMKEASNVIFAAALSSTSDALAPVFVNRLQEGCVRFSYVPIGSRTPRRHRCQPDLAIAEAIDNEKRINPALPLSVQETIRSTIQGWLVPSFTSERYGHPAYAQLSRVCPQKIAAGADDESEMGVYYHLKNPQRLSNLRTRLREYLPIGLEAGAFFVS
jgi:hypothetical protein